MGDEPNVGSEVGDGALERRDPIGPGGCLPILLHHPDKERSLRSQ